MILAIDLGSTAFKAALFDRRLRELRFGARPLQYRYASQGRVEITVAAVDAALRGSMQDAIGRQGGDIEAVAITSQAQTFTLLDERARPQIPFISWRDRRPEAIAAAARLEKALPDFSAHAGFATVSPAQWIAQLKAMRPPADCRPALLPVYVLNMLTDSFCCDANQAAMTGLYSLKIGAWWPRAIRICGLGASRMPAIVPAGHPGGVTGRGARRFGLPPGIPVILAGNDQTAGAYGVGVERNDGVLLTLGTAIVLYAHCPDMPPPKSRRIRGPYPGGGYYVLTADGCGGALIKWAQTLLAGCPDDDEFFAAAAKSPPGSRGLVFRPSAATGGGDWLGGGPEHTVGEFSRALLECLSVRTADCLKELGLKTKPRVIRAAGGGSRRRLWLDMIADLTGAHVKPAKGTPLKGAARMAGLYLRENPRPSQEKQSPTGVNGLQSAPCRGIKTTPGADA